MQALCKECPEGFYCDSTLQNDTVCSHGVQNPVPCPAGHFCPNGTKFSSEYGCLRGTFSSQSGLTSSAECSPCSPGMYCLTEGLTTPSGPCQAGYYCTAGASSSTPSDNTTGNICPAGAHCPEGSPAPSLCPPGTFNPTEGTLAISLYYQFSWVYFVSFFIFSC